MGLRVYVAGRDAVRSHLSDATPIGPGRRSTSGRSTSGIFTLLLPGEAKQQQMHRNLVSPRRGIPTKRVYVAQVEMSPSEFLELL